MFNGRRVAQTRGESSPRSSLSSSSYLHVLGGSGGGEDGGQTTPAVPGSVPSQDSMPSTVLRHMSTVVGPALNRGLMSASRAIARAADHVEPGRQQQGHLPTAEEELVFDVGERGSGSPIGTRSRNAVGAEPRNTSVTFDTGAGGGSGNAGEAGAVSQPDALSYVEFNPETCCGGAVGRMGKVCLVSATVCAVQAHSTKVLSEAGYIATGDARIGYLTSRRCWSLQQPKRRPARSVRSVVDPMLWAPSVPPPPPIPR